MRLVEFYAMEEARENSIHYTIENDGDVGVLKRWETSSDGSHDSQEIGSGDIDELIGRLSKEHFGKNVSAIEDQIRQHWDMILPGQPEEGTRLWIGMEGGRPWVDLETIGTDESYGVNEY